MIHDHGRKGLLEKDGQTDRQEDKQNQGKGHGMDVEEDDRLRETEPEN